MTRLTLRAASAHWHMSRAYFTCVCIGENNDDFLVFGLIIYECVGTSHDGGVCCMFVQLKVNMVQRAAIIAAVIFCTY